MTVIKLKRSETASSAPTSSDIEVGEVCMNITDKKIYTKKSDNSIVVMSEPATATETFGVALDGLLVKCPDGSRGGISVDGLLTKVAQNDAVGKISKLLDDTNPVLGGDLSLNSKSITGTGTIAGTITGVTQSAGDNSTKLATTAYADAAGSGAGTASEKFAQKMAIVLG